MLRRLRRPLLRPHVHVQLNQSYTTKPIVVPKISDQTGSTTNDKHAAANAALATAMRDALRELPNYVIDDCEMDCDFQEGFGINLLFEGVGADYLGLRCKVEFTGSSVAGPQYLLEVEADKCDSGCTPQLSNPVRLKSALRPSTEAACLYPDEDKVCSTAFWSKVGHGFVGTAGIDNSATTLPVTDGADFGGDSTCPFSSCGYIQVGSEVMQLTAVAGTSLTVVRGQDGTTAAAHADGDMVHWLGAKVDGVHPDILSSVFEQEEADYNSFECGRRGKCDYSSGECECFEGYMGDRCQTQTALI